MKENNQRGFTLVELLVVIAIIGIMAAIAIPMFAKYRMQAFNTRAANDMRTLIAGQEAYYVDHEDYLSCGSPDTGLPDCVGTLPGVAALSAGIHYVMIGDLISVVPVMAPEEEEAPASGFLAIVCHEKGDHGYAFQSLAESGDQMAGVVQRGSFECPGGLEGIIDLLSGGGGPGGDELT